MSVRPGIVCSCLLIALLRPATSAPCTADSSVPGSTISSCVAQATPGDVVTLRGEFFEDVDLGGKSLSFTKDPVSLSRPKIHGSFGHLNLTSAATTYSSVSVTSVDFVTPDDLLAPRPTPSVVFGPNTAFTGALSFDDCGFTFDTAPTKAATAVSLVTPASVDGGVRLRGCSWGLGGVPVQGGAVFRVSVGSGSIEVEGCQVTGKQTVAAAVVSLDHSNTLYLRTGTGRVTVTGLKTANGGSLYVEGGEECEIVGCSFDGLGVALDGVHGCKVHGNTVSNLGTYVTGFAEATAEPRGITLKATAPDATLLNVKVYNNTFAGVYGTEERHYGAITLNEFPALPSVGTMNSVFVYGNDFSRVAHNEYAVRNWYTTNSVVLKARYNFWYDASGPAESCNPQGRGPLVSSAVDYWDFCLDHACSATTPGDDACAVAAKGEIDGPLIAFIVLCCVLALCVIAGLLWATTFWIRRKPLPEAQEEEIVTVVSQPAAEPQQAVREIPLQEVAPVPSKEVSMVGPEAPEIIKPDHVEGAAKPAHVEDGSQSGQSSPSEVTATTTTTVETKTTTETKDTLMTTETKETTEASVQPSVLAAVAAAAAKEASSEASVSEKEPEEEPELEFPGDEASEFGDM